MSSGWTAADVRRIGEAGELLIATERRDGTQRPWTPIWVVVFEGRVFVRSWHYRETGWFGDAERSGRARIRAADLELDVTVTNVGAGPADLRRGIDSAYRTKYGDAPGSSMCTSAAIATTLALDCDE